MVHPEVFIPEYKEVHFFDRHYENGIDWYLEIFRDSTKPVKGEATPAYFYSDDIRGLIDEHLPGVKLIVILRDPVDRAYSHYWYLRSKKKSKNPRIIPFEEKIASKPRLIEEGKYADRLEKLFEQFGRDRVLIHLFEDIKSNPNGLLEKTYKFLGVDASFVSPLLNVTVNSAAVKIGNRKWVTLLAKIAHRSGLSSLNRWLDEKNKLEIQPVSNETRLRLIGDVFFDDIDRLEKLLDADLTAWKS